MEDLASGCICCDLNRQVPEAWKALQAAFHPDVILVEPSGLAAPGILRNTFTGLVGRDDELVNIYLVDLVDFSRRKGRLGPFIQQAVATADIVVPTKASLVEREIPTRFRAVLDQDCPDV